MPNVWQTAYNENENEKKIIIIKTQMKQRAQQAIDKKFFAFAHLHLEAVRQRENKLLVICKTFTIVLRAILDK